MVHFGLYTCIRQYTVRTEMYTTNIYIHAHILFFSEQQRGEGRRLGSYGLYQHLSLSNWFQKYYLIFEIYGITESFIVFSKRELYVCGERWVCEECGECELRSVLCMRNHVCDNSEVLCVWVRMRQLTVYVEFWNYIKAYMDYTA